MIERYKAIATILQHVGARDLVLSTTGMISREVFMTNDRPGNFYMLGSMGLLSAFGLGLALLSPEQRVFILEGDGSALMSLGTLPLIAAEGPANLIHIILDNEAYESTGAQPSISAQVDLAQVGQSCGYKCVRHADNSASIDQALAVCLASPGPALLLIKVGIAPVSGIPRVSHSPTAIRDRFHSAVQQQG
jgi:thiamine pyrophosphate-dependent acetolactate synthase large subunit-like protein